MLLNVLLWIIRLSFCFPNFLVVVSISHYHYIPKINKKPLENIFGPTIVVLSKLLLKYINCKEKSDKKTFKNK
jgi:hypothetical protein